MRSRNTLPQATQKFSLLAAAQLTVLMLPGLGAASLLVKLAAESPRLIMAGAPSGMYSSMNVCDEARWWWLAEEATEAGREI